MKFSQQLPDIIFQVGDNEYKLGSYTHADLPETELNWLAYEISNFLNLPITKQSPHAT